MMRREFLKYAGKGALGMGLATLNLPFTDKLGSVEEPSKESSILNVGDNVNLEVKRYYKDKESPSIILAKGLGGCARRNALVDKLAQDFNIVTFSPRNSGKSNGNFTMDNYVNDLEILVDGDAQKRGVAPYGLGHSTGGYAFARLIGEKPLVKKAALLSPLIDISEQNPELLNWYLNRCIKNGKNPANALTWFYNGKASNKINIAQQRFDPEDISPFIESVYDAPICEEKLTVPTKVYLSGGTCMNLPLKNQDLEELKESWEKLGADVEIHPKLNHWYSSPWFSPSKNFFSSEKCQPIEESIKEYFV